MLVLTHQHRFKGLIKTEHLFICNVNSVSNNKPKCTIQEKLSTFVSLISTEEELSKPQNLFFCHLIGLFSFHSAECYEAME